MALSILATAAYLHLPLGAWLVVTPERLASGELWRLLAGPLVHATTEHAIRDLGLLAILGLIYEPLVGRRFGLVLLASTAVAPLAAFLSEPAMVAYFGMSSTVHGAVAAAMVTEWRRSNGRPPVWVMALSLIIPACLLLELFAGPMIFHLDLGQHIRSVPLTHLAGFASGALCMVGHGEVPQGRDSLLSNSLPCGKRDSSSNPQEDPCPCPSPYTEKT